MTKDIGLENSILEVLCKHKHGLAFNEIYKELIARYREIRKIEAREALSKLIRTGKVERVADHERRRMVFKSKDGC